MIPIGDKIFLSTNKKPLVVWFLIGINIALFLWEVKLEFGGELASFVNNWGLIPQQITTAFSSAIAGNPAAWLIVFWRLLSILSGMFIHGSYSQIVGNLIFLWVFGNTLEKIIGSGRFLLFYLFCGFLTGIVQVFAEPGLTVPLIGANGAIASVLGAYIYKFPKVKIDSILPLVILYIPVELPAFFYAFWWFVQQLFYGIGSLNIPGGVNPMGTGYLAHGVGLLIGVVWMVIMKL
ncbi:rhomboid family intramembrane serine protease [Plectonema cf. radiosum LEGE 06105]|uniref:Rhomboid family intramembrane serine protease n=1 Tax=Plectonema cf. radiosum LEGE 06105 TaxID=945769 RepID=A0A8J7K3M4_9CYAN|nr:rhomboid family intramembrane serine protease [Plectonema radiosum]MBE9215866.1 rhomboid family intramembrane serine protease [Plectonema cf. radiosum LEGE 06105]